MLWAAALLLVAGELWTASELRGLRETEDVRDAGAIEQAFERRLAELERFALDLAPSDLEAELVEALLALERLHPEAAMQWSRRVVENVPSTELTWAARSVLARGGDRRTLRLALRRYFDDPDAWRVVLGDGALATEDVRLRDYEPYGRPVALPGERLFRSQLEQSLGIKKPDNVLVGPSFLDVVRGIDAFPNDDALSVQSLVVGLPPAYRLRALRYLATSDHRALVGLPMAAAEIDRLYPYFAQSRHRPLRDRVRRSIAARAAALASLLLSPAAGDDEKRAHLAAMEDVWLDAIARGGPEVYRVLVTLVGEAAVERHIATEPPTRALAVAPLAAARLRLEQWGSADAIRGLGEREDLLLSLPTLTALRRGSAGRCRARDRELALEHRRRRLDGVSRERDRGRASRSTSAGHHECAGARRPRARAHACGGPRDAVTRCLLCYEPLPRSRPARFSRLAGASRRGPCRAGALGDGVFGGRAQPAFIGGPRCPAAL